MDELEKIRLKKQRELIDKLSTNDSSVQAPSEPIKVTDASFDEFIKQNEFSLIDCWAAWCAPCRTLAPIIDALAKELRGKVMFGKLNVDENPKTAAIYGIMSIPTMLLFTRGRLIDQTKGALPKDALKNWILKDV